MPGLRFHRFRARIIDAVFVGVLVQSGCSEPQPQAANPPMPVSVMVASRTSVTSAVRLTGEIRARVESDLGFRFAGQIASRLADVGDRVEAGQVLAALDSTRQTADVSAATARVQSAQAQLTQAQAAFERQKALLVKGFTTQSNFDDAQLQMQTAQASLETAQADLGTARDSLGNTQLRADATGIITARNAEVGQVVQAAQAVFTLAKDGPRDAVFEVYESLLTAPPDQNQVEIMLLSNPAVKAVGTVREAAPAIDPNTGTIRVKIGVDATPPEMQLGSAVSGVGRFHKRDLFDLPWTAFFVANDKPAVWVVDPKSNAASTREVEVDSYQTRRLLLASGLSDGDMVVTAGVQLLRAGQVVAPRPADALSAGGQ